MFIHYTGGFGPEALSLISLPVVFYRFWLFNIFKFSVIRRFQCGSLKAVHEEGASTDYAPMRRSLASTENINRNVLGIILKGIVVSRLLPSLCCTNHSFARYDETRSSEQRGAYTLLKQTIPLALPNVLRLPTTNPREEKQ